MNLVDLRNEGEVISRIEGDIEIRRYTPEQLERAKQSTPLAEIRYALKGADREWLSHWSPPWWFAQHGSQLAIDADFYRRVARVIEADYAALRGQQS